MKAKSLLLLSVCCLMALSIRAQKLDWFSLWGSSTEGSHIRVNRMAVDSDDNAYVAADFCGNAVSVEDRTLVSSQGSDLGDAALIKVTPTKEIAWIRTFSESRQSKIYDIVVDRQDNIIVAGTFTGTINPAGNNPLTFDAGEYDDCTVNAFVARFDKNGALLGQWRIPAYELTSLRVAVDGDGNVYLAGTYGSYILFAGTTGVGTFSVDNQLFLAKYSPDGVLLTSKYTEAQNVAYSNATVQVDANGDIYLAGTFTGTFLFAGQTFATGSDNDMFLAKYNASFSEVWAKRIGGSGSNEKGIDVVLSPLGDVAVGGTIVGTSLTISDVDSTFSRQYGSTTLPHSAITTFTKNGDFRWQYWYGYSTGEAILSALRCTDEGVYYMAFYASGRGSDISTGKGLVAGQNSGFQTIDGQHLSHNTNGGADAVCCVVSPEGGLCNYMRLGGAQSEYLNDIALSADRKKAYILLGLCVRGAAAQIPIDNFFVSFTDITANQKLSDFTSITVPCPETVAAGGSYSATYKGVFYSGVLLSVAFPEITPNVLPLYTSGTAYSQTLSLSNPVGTARFIPLHLPQGLTLNGNQLSGTLTGTDTQYVTLIFSDSVPRYSYFSAYGGDTTYDGLTGGQTTRGNSRNIRNFILKESTTSGLKAVQNAAPRIFYPTVVTDAIQVRTDAQPFTVNIYNTLGARVLTADNQQTIDLKALSPGIYLAEIIANGLRKAERFVVK
ncbi:MAG: T9SS type A sorting domain-containing protein [Dysgonamonadaceae bacterium]|jgi:hypothetical protein|nr:T9SS type A sorting domain-containing protein [Dysgonamonadaceae bacterium]